MDGTRNAKILFLPISGCSRSLFGNCAENSSSLEVVGQLAPDTAASLTVQTFVELKPKGMPYGCGKHFFIIRITVISYVDGTFRHLGALAIIINNPY